MTRDVLVAAGVFFIVYLTGSFLAWDFNPGNWDEKLRGFVAFVGWYGAFSAVVMVRMGSNGR